MAKAKTFKKRGKSSRTPRSKPFDINKVKGIKLRDEIVLEDYDPDIGLADVESVGKALIQCLFEGDNEAFKEILSAHLEVVNKDILSKRSGVSRSTLFRMLGPDSNPTLKNVLKLCKALKAS